MSLEYYYTREFPVSTQDCLLNGLVELRENKLLCDVDLICEGETFSVHRVILAAASPYFQVMFTGGFKESGQSAVTLNKTSLVGLKLVLDALYTSKLTLSDDTVQAVLSVAHMFQMKALVTVCDEYILENFEDVAETDHLEKLPMELFQGYISNQRLRLPNGEIEVFRAVVKWMAKNQSSEDAMALFREIRFSHIPADLIVAEFCNQPTITLMYKNADCRSHIQEAMQFHRNPYKQPLFDETLHKPRGISNLVVIPGGTRKREDYSVTETKTKCQFIEFEDQMSISKNRFCEELPFAMVYDSVSVVTAGNYLYLFGAKNEHFSSVVMRFDSITKKWLDLKAPCEGARIGATHTVVGSDIFRVGGIVVTKETKVNYPCRYEEATDCSIYVIESNAWFKCRSLPDTELHKHTSVSVDRTLYVAGGLDSRSRTTNGLYAYSGNNTWQTKSRMNESRYNFSLEAINGNLYACGGVTNEGRTLQNVTSVEVYNISQNQWTRLRRVSLHGLTSIASVVLEEKIFITGETRCQEKNENIGTVYCLDTGKNTIAHVFDLPFPLGNHCCASLIVPRR